MIDRYDWAGGSEAILRFGPSSGPVVVMALPLFEEANRTRAFAVTILRLLGERGIVGALPDLPGTGESLVATEDARLSNWRAAFRAAAGHVSRHGPVHIAAIRSGALVIDEARAVGAWQLSPVTGAELVRELMRVRQAAGAAATPPEDGTIEIAGNRIAEALLNALSEAPRPELPTRVVRLESEARPGDVKLPGAPLWRRVEPDNDLTLAQILADDIEQWIEGCAG